MKVYTTMYRSKFGEAMRRRRRVTCSLPRLVVLALARLAAIVCLGAFLCRGGWRCRSRICRLSGAGWLATLLGDLGSRHSHGRGRVWRTGRRRWPSRGSLLYATTVGRGERAERTMMLTLFAVGAG